MNGLLIACIFVLTATVKSALNPCAVGASCRRSISAGGNVQDLQSAKMDLSKWRFNLKYDIFKKAMELKEREQKKMKNNGQNIKQFLSQSKLTATRRQQPAEENNESSIDKKALLVKKLDVFIQYLKLRKSLEGLID